MIKYLLVALAVLITSRLAEAQIIVEGKNPSNPFKYGNIKRGSIGIAYGNVLWVDEGDVPLKGYSLPNVGQNKSESFTDKINIATGFYLNYENTISRKFSLQTSAFAGKMLTGKKPSLNVEKDESKFYQVSIYGKLSLTNPQKKLQFQWLFGPEVLYAQKDAVISEYVESSQDVPQDYNQKVNVVEGAIVTGLGFSLDVSRNLGLYNNTCVGIALPGIGLKVSATIIGLRYNFL